MKYKAAKVISHPRAGSHYLAHLLNINFFHLPNYLPLYAGHSTAHMRYLDRPDTAVFYIYRDNVNTIESMYNMRNRFGLVANSFEEFKNTRLCDMHNVNIKSEAIKDNGIKKELVSDVDTYLSRFDQTPEEYLNAHKKFWLNIHQSNYHVLMYEDLLYEFEHTMEMIAWFLESSKHEFIQEEKRIGWYDKYDTKEKFC